MHPPLWHPPIELSVSEQVIVSRIRRAKLFIFLRQIRHRLSEAGVEILNGLSLKAALDIDWDHPEQRQLALEQVLQALEY